MEKINLLPTLDMKEYLEKIKDYSFDELMAEKKKIEEKLDVLYTCMGPNYYYQDKINIKDNPEEMNRIYIRKQVSTLVKIISGQLKDFSADFSLYWDYINKKFLETTSDPDYVTAKLKGKSNVAFADKLNLSGLVAYKRYLLFLSDNIQKMSNLEMAVHLALDAEMEVDYGKRLDRGNFYTRKFLPASIDSVHKKLVKIKVLNDALKVKGNVEKAQKADEITK